MDNKVTYVCKICGKSFTKIQGLSLHITKSHPYISKKEYYIEFINHKDDGRCKICGKDKTFKNLTLGFTKYCSLRCAGLDPENIKKRSSNLSDWHNEYRTNEIRTDKNRDIYLKKASEEIGNKYGALKILDVYKDIDNRCTVAKCICDCGKEKDIRLTEIKNGHIKTCGCRTGLFEIKGNRYEEKGDFIMGYTSNADTFFIDKVDYVKAKGFTWVLGDDGYLHTTRRVDGNVKNLRLHKIILTTEGGNYVDHINGDKSDNRRCNLREVTPSQNGMNKRIQSNNSSGHPGVSVHKSKGSTVYRSRIKKDGKTIYLGQYSEFVDALEIRLIAEKIFFKNYNKQLIEYDLPDTINTENDFFEYLEEYKFLRDKRRKDTQVRLGIDSSAYK